MNQILKIIKRDVKNYGILFLMYLILQYLAVFLIEEVGKLLNNNAYFLVEYFYYFLMVLGIIFLSLGSLLLFVYFIIRPALEDKAQNIKLKEEIVLYRFLTIIGVFFIGLFNFFLALSVITDFDISILFEQSIQLYIGLSFGIEVVLSIILLIYTKIYKGIYVINKFNIFIYFINIGVIYIAGNLYYLYYFKIGMIVLLSSYLLLFLNIKIIVNKIGQTKFTKAIWGILLLILVILIGLSFLKGENLDKKSTVHNEGPNGQKVYEYENTSKYEEIDSKYGIVKKYIIEGDNEKYILNYKDKLYMLNVYPDSYDFNMQSLNTLEYINIYNNTGDIYLNSSTLIKKEQKQEQYMICNGSYEFEEILLSDCVDKDSKDLINYIKDNEKYIVK